MFHGSGDDLKIFTTMMIGGTSETLTLITGWYASQDNIKGFFYDGSWSLDVWKTQKDLSIYILKWVT
jgi:hypothetical protein